MAAYHSSPPAAVSSYSSGGASVGVFSGTPIPTQQVAPSPPVPSILDKPMSKGTTQVSLSAFSYIFSEMVQYCQQRVDAVQELEKK